jgi:hypothetical protein
LVDQYTFLAICIAIAVASGYLGGYATVRINQLLVILLGRAWTSGRARKRYNLMMAYSAIIYLIALVAFLYPGEHLAIKLVSVAIFAGQFVIGIKHAEKRYKQALDIMDRIIKAMFHTSLSEPASTLAVYNKHARHDNQRGQEEEAAIRDALRISKDILDAMPKSNAETLKVLFLFLDSRTAVFIISLSAGKWRFRRFSELSWQEQQDYLDTWNENSFLFYAIQGIKSLVSFSYFSSPNSWQNIGYNGDFLRWSYIR